MPVKHRKLNFKEHQELVMQFKTRHKHALAATILVSPPPIDKDMIGDHDIEARNHPALQAAAYRKEDTG